MSWGKSVVEEPLTAAEAFEKLRLEDLRPLVEVVKADVPKRKPELVAILAAEMTNPQNLRQLYGLLDSAGRNAVRFAVADPHGKLDRVKFRARHGDLPRFDTAGPMQRHHMSYQDQQRIKPLPVRLFFPYRDTLPSDTRKLLREFVPPPEPFALPTVAEPPETVTLRDVTWDRHKANAEQWEEPVRVRSTAAAAEADVRTVLRLIEAGKLRVTDKKLVPVEVTRKAVSALLSGGDFYTGDDGHDYKHDPAFDLGIRAFAWPLLMQAGRLAEKSTSGLRLTAAGRKAQAAEPATVLDKLWAAWLDDSTFDEFARIDAIKGQGVADMSSVVKRRAVLADALTACPVGQWFAVNDFFRLLRATGQKFQIASDAWSLYISESEYGSLGYDDSHAWEQLQGRYALAFLFEIAATLGLIDVAYVPPQYARHDFRSRWGADDLSCLSRYDGLLYVRVNPLGAWVFGHAPAYTRPEPERKEVFRVLANLDVVAAHAVPPADRLALERYAAPGGEGVWTLTKARILEAIESGGSLYELELFLKTHLVGELPRTAEVFLDDLRARVGLLTDGGPARLIACASELVAAELAADRSLKGKCLRAGPTHLAVRVADLAAVRKVARKLGHVWPVMAE